MRNPPWESTVGVPCDVLPVTAALVEEVSARCHPSRLLAQLTRRSQEVSGSTLEPLGDGLPASQGLVDAVAFA
jgi:hypothetical protein